MILSAGKTRTSVLVTGPAFHTPKIQRNLHAGVSPPGEETVQVVHQATADTTARRVNIRGLGKTVIWTGETVTPILVLKAVPVFP